MGFLRDLFGPSKEEVWVQLAEQVKGRLTDDGFVTTRLVASSGSWTLTLDTHREGKHTYTRLRAPYINADNFQFTIYPEGYFSSIGRALGMQDISIGDPHFDAAYIIKGNDEAKVRKFFDDEKLKSLLHKQNDLSFTFQVKDDDGWFGSTFPQGVDELYFEQGGVITDLGQLRALFDLFYYTLHRLCQLGSAYEKDPGVTL